MAVVTPTIARGGVKMDDAYAVVSIDTRREVGRIPQAELRIMDGSVAKRKFAISDGDFFAPGSELTIDLRHEGTPKEHRVFGGIVVRHGVEVDASGNTVLVVGLKDPAVKLTGRRRSNVFSGLSDSAIISQLIREAQCKCGQIAPTSGVLREMVQYQSTSWDFILSRAEMLGLLVAVEDGAVSLRKMALAAKAAHSFELGIDELFDVEIEADASHQVADIESIGWDSKQHKPTAAQRAASVKLSPGNLDGGKLGKAVGNEKWLLNHAVPVPVEELKSWANATMGKSRMALLRGRFGVSGRGDLKLLDTIAIAGIGSRFNGKTLVTGVRHRVGPMGWRTDLQFGLSPERFARRDDIQEVPAAGLLPAVSGLQIGIVAAVDTDREQEQRIKVFLPAVDMTKPVWARLATPSAGNGRGFCFRPEPKDEVVVGFLNEDPRCPVILGSLFGSKNLPPKELPPPDSKSQHHGIVTKGGTTIGFVDGKKSSAFITTASGSKLLLDDQAGTVKLTDANKNSIVLSKTGIEISSAKNITIKAGKEVVLDGPKVSVK